MAQEPVIMIADDKNTGIKSRGNRINGQAARVIIEDAEQDQGLQAETSDAEQAAEFEQVPFIGLDRAKFFSQIRKSLFKGRLKQIQVDRINAVLDELEYAAIEHFGAWAYALATGHHESAEWLYYKELGSTERFTRLYDIKGQRPAKAKELGNVRTGDGARYCGRGPVGITGRSNYRKQGAKLGIDLENSPALAEQSDIGARLLVEGMRDGDYRRRSDGSPYKLDDYFNGKRCDYIGARNIVNAGLDKAELIASYATAYYAALDLASSDSAIDYSPIYEPVEDDDLEQQEIAVEAYAEPEPEPEPELQKPKWFKNPLDWFAGWKTHLIMLTTAGLAAAELFGVVIPEQLYVLLGALGLSTAYRGVTRNKRASKSVIEANEK